MQLVTSRIAAGLVGLAGLGLATSTFAAQVPIVGTGYNADVIADAGDTGAPVTSVSPGGIDSQFAYFQTGFIPTAPTNGLLTGAPAISAADANTTFLLQPANANNVVFLTQAANTQTFTLTTPAAYSTLSFAATGTNGSQPFTYTFNYTDGTSSAVGSATAPDNFGGTNTAIFTGGRVDIASGGAEANTTNPRIYQIDTTGLNSGLALQSVTLTATNLAEAGRTNIAVFSVSGTPVPEPASLSLLGVGAMGLLARRRRAR